MWKEFKAFATKGNVLDLSIAVVIGGAFGKIIESLVDDVVMPVVGLLMGGVNLQALHIQFALGKGTVYIQYGAFLQSAVDFFIITFAIFLFLKVIFRLRGKAKGQVQFQEETTDQILGDIRDLLRERSHMEQNSPNHPIVYIQKNKEKTANGRSR
ncbi:large conductance mechanosensitive channel protein MscL [Pontibacillus sp. HN14]|nr:large conductance mechanosensitive channel protein MscL [Pontibacillus sp. HN14]MCD5322558.1 large conductance mechanosensitive channel protein MscL [Pontibacillus sp. HN14]